MNNKLSFTVSISGFEDKFVVTEFVGDECLSQTFTFTIQLASRFAGITAVDIVDKNVKLTQFRDNKPTRSWFGVISSFTIGDTGHNHTIYNITMVPALERLSLRRNSRIFQVRTVPEIISDIFIDAGITEFAFMLSKDYVKREYCIQYRETDLEFIQRILAEEGIFFFFEQATNDRVLFSDNSTLLTSFGDNTKFPYNAISGGSSPIPNIHTFAVTKQIKPSSVTLKDYSFKNPNYSFLLAAQAGDANYQKEYKYYDHPGRYKSDDPGKSFTQVRLEGLRNKAIYATSKSNIEYMTTGFKFYLQEHPDNSFNRDWTLISINHKGTQPQALEEAGGEGITTYNNTFTVVPGNISWRPDPITKPIIPGTQTATVVGPKGEEIYCDEYGRVKVFFPWDLYHPNDDSCSCWIRVSQGWAGSQYGMVAVPRVGNEVLVSFLNGDPDQPIITGSNYNAINKPPFDLPSLKTRTGIKTSTHQGEGFNELHFEDQSGQEQIYLRAQRNLEELILNDHKTHVQNEQHTTVDSHQYTHIKGMSHNVIESDMRTKITGNQTQVTEGNSDIKTMGNTSLISKGSTHIQSAQDIVIEAGSSITLVVGGTFIKLDASTLALVSQTVNINSGGAPTKGAGFLGSMPMLPGEVIEGEIVAPSLMVSKEAFLQAELGSIATIKPCPLASK